MFGFYSYVYGTLDRVGIPLTFSHHILEYHFFFKRGLALCNPMVRQGQILFKKEHIFFGVLFLLNIGILAYYFNDIELSEKLYNSLAFFHCFVAAFFFYDYFKPSSILKKLWIVVSIIPISVGLCYVLFFQYDSDGSNIILTYILDIHLVIWFIIFYYDFRNKSVSKISILLVIGFWLLYFSESGGILDEYWVFFSFNHIAFESYLVLKHRIIKQKRSVDHGK
ncbi:MAG: hypothetical protein IEMM0008_1168 [bacterium]|nr:MAG: hypothetical protein IEMM0008_1168 [bacterium]